jgi:hypothetical protein
MGASEFRERMNHILTSIIRSRSEAVQEPAPFTREEEEQFLDREPPAMWAYAREYNRNASEGHQRRPAAFGCPTLVMHMGVWQKRQSDEIYHFDERTAIEKKFGSFDEHNETFVEEVNKFIISIQKLGRVLRKDEAEDSNIDSFSFAGVEATYQARRRRKSGKAAHKFKSHDPQSVAFTLWWQDCGPDFKPVRNRRAVHPDLSAIRTRVQACAYTDHVTISFFIDVGKPYGHRQIYSPHEVKDTDIGNRRRRINNCLRTIREVSAQQIREGYVERDRIPEQGVTPGTARELLEAADYLYDGVWRDFMESFDIQDAALIGGGRNGRGGLEGERFADYRGLMMSVPGLETPPNRERLSNAEALRRDLMVKEPQNPRERNANVGVGSLNNFDFDNNEPNTILKSLWPFLRRMTPWADYKDFVGCGMIGRRLIYVSPIDATGKFYPDEEGPDRAAEIPALHLPADEEENGNRHAPRPIRYLALTRGEPHREQTGRFIELINAAATKRLFALKKFVTIKNAGVHVRLLGRELDGILQLWGDERKKIEDWCNWELYKLERPGAGRQIENNPGDAIVAYLMANRPWDLPGGKNANGETQFDPAEVERLRMAYKKDYSRPDLSLEAILEEHPERVWIKDATIHHVFREVARNLDADAQKRNGNCAGASGGAEATLKLAEKAPGLKDFLSGVAQLQAQEQQDVPSARKQQLGDARAEKTSLLVKEVEQGLVEIGAALDNIGNGGAGRILYAINRAKHTIGEFEKIVGTMGVTNIDGWVNYGQFVERGVSPSFDLIRSTGDRLISLRSRLQSVTEMIQTSALIAEAEATRANTATLRKIISNLYYVGAPMAVVAAGMIGEALETVLPPELGFGSGRLKLGFMAAAVVVLTLYKWLRRPQPDGAPGENAGRPA